MCTCVPEMVLYEIAMLSHIKRSCERMTITSGEGVGGGEVIVVSGSIPTQVEFVGTINKMLLCANKSRR